MDPIQFKAKRTMRWIRSHVQRGLQQDRRQDTTSAAFSEGRHTARKYVGEDIVVSAGIQMHSVPYAPEQEPAYSSDFLTLGGAADGILNSMLSQYGTQSPVIQRQIAKHFAQPVSPKADSIFPMSPWIGAESVRPHINSSSISSLRSGEETASYRKHRHCYACSAAISGP
ncbi:hypothetical protein DM02DRAFT_651792 [Periconia macrospinosa]|uniref:Uncharacterized protein n=1 Tax=Periconia macrospinosa TaxID=97972 RepID=A0A2V1E1K4_9PLEO|nr:hypothetical protein DM02DRAFT_651792 [Periconia macrospinosa]